MNSKTLRKVQLVQLEMAKEVKRVCKELNIDYHLDSGTLLGAVRHKGFIPWDDDLDIGMTRSNYEKFIKQAPSILSNDYFLQTWYSDKEFGLPFAKLRKKGTLYIEEGAQYSSAENGFYIDIIPYNVYPNGFLQKIIQGSKYDLYRRLILMKCNYTPWKADDSNNLVKKFIYLPFKFLSVFFTKEILIRSYEKTCTRYENKNYKFCFPSGTSNYGKWIINRKCLLKLNLLKFEDDYFLCPKDYDVYLKAVYGNYMELPPKDKRENRHRIIKLSFGNCNNEIEVK